MRFLLAPAIDAAYDRRIMEGLGAAIEASQEGHRVKVCGGPINGHDRSQIMSLLETADIVIQVNSARQDFMPPFVRNVSWIHDTYMGLDDEVAAKSKSGDIVYLLGSPKLLTMRAQWPVYMASFFTGLSSVWLSDVSPTPVEPQIDMSLCGYISNVGAKRIFVSPDQDAVEFRRDVDQAYRPLSGASDMTKLNMKHGKILEPSMPKEYCRLQDRRLLAMLALSVTSSIEFWGYNWDNFPEFRPYARGFVDNADGLKNVYERSRLNLNSNPDGLGLHSRVIECMARGGVIMMHRSPNETEIGGMRWAFEPGEHFIEFTPGNFTDMAREALDSFSMRRRVGKKARELVISKHRWKDRVDQLLADLEK